MCVWEGQVRVSGFSQLSDSVSGLAGVPQVLSLLSEFAELISDRLAHWCGFPAHFLGHADWHDLLVQTCRKRWKKRKSKAVSGFQTCFQNHYPQPTS